jgi:hypothetical protein
MIFWPWHRYERGKLSDGKLIFKVGYLGEKQESSEKRALVPVVYYGKESSGSWPEQGSSDRKRGKDVAYIIYI